MIDNVDFLCKSFNNGILDMISTHSYNVYVINRDENIICTCVESSTKQGNANCKKCLGTGHKIKINKIKCAAQDTRVPPTFRADTFIIARNYFIESKYKINEEDLIVDNGDIYIIFEIQKLFSIKGTLPYKKVNSTKKKYDNNVFIKNFNEIIKKYKL